MNFPQYRKYKNIDTYFKIISEKEFIEISLMGKRVVKHRIIATQYPEMLRIQDMLNCENGTWEVIEEKFFVGVEMRKKRREKRK